MVLGIAAGVNPIQGRTRLEGIWYAYIGAMWFPVRAPRLYCNLYIKLNLVAEHGEWAKRIQTYLRI